MIEKNVSDFNTSGNSVSIRNYYKDLRKLGTLSSEEQTELAIKARNGDQKALNKLVESNLRFVLKIAKEYLWSGIPLEELASEGNIGLIKSIPRYDETKGFKFISYAVWWIRQSIMQSVYDNGSSVRLPINKIGQLGKINKTTDKLVQKLEREPTINEVVELSELTEKEVKTSMLSVMSYVSMDSKIKDESEGEIGDLIPGESIDDLEIKSNLESLRESINEIFKDFSTREVKILTMHFGLNNQPEMTLKEIGEELDLTNERVRQIKEFAFKKLRMYGKSSALKEYLECKLM